MLAEVYNFGGLNPRARWVRELVALAWRQNISPNHLLAVMQIESGFDPAATNPGPSQATGLIQFLPSTAKAYGTTVARLRRMTRSEQLPYVERFMAENYHGARDPADVYLATFGRGIGRPDSYVLARRGQPAYDQNKALDIDGDGRIRAGDLRTIINRKVAAARVHGTTLVEFDPTQRYARRNGASRAAVALAVGLAAAGALYAAS